LISYHENEINLGFDANLRQLLRKAQGDYCLFLGNDDVLCDGALENISNAIDRYPDIGVVLRGYGWFEKSPDNVIETIRYFREETFIPAGLDALAFFYRRSCVLAGLTIARQPALELETSVFDGSLFYQLHLVGNIVLKYNGLFVPEIIALCRADEKPDFGHSSSEQGKHTPGEYTIEARLSMMGGIVDIAKAIDQNHKGALEKVLTDVANYSFFWLAYHADKPFKTFYNYYKKLGSLGLGSYQMFHLYFFCLAIFGVKKMEWLISSLRRLLGHTPRLS
jgi:glycosyltransferase involved in cell wall biosynthesis